MWQFSNEEIVKLQNRINDVWEIVPSLEHHDEYVAAVGRLIGAFDMMMNAKNYYILGYDKSHD